MASVDSSGLLSLGQASAAMGVTPQCLRQWTNRGQFPCVRSPGGTRYFRRTDVNSHVYGFEEEKFSRKRVLLYARTSTHNQAKNFSKGSMDNDLGRQLEDLKNECKKRYGNKCDVIEIAAVCSGLNYEAEPFQKMIKKVINSEIDVLMLRTRERACRFGFSMLEILCDKFGVEIVVLSPVEKNKETFQDLSTEILELCTCAAARMHGARGGASCKKHISQNTIKRILVLKQEGLSVKAITRQLRRERHYVSSKLRGKELISQNLVGKCVKEMI